MERSQKDKEEKQRVDKVANCNRNELSVKNKDQQHATGRADAQY